MLGRFCILDMFDPENVSGNWFKNMTLVSSTASKASEYVSDIEESYHYLIICAVVAFVVSIISLIIIRYFAGIFVWVTILGFILGLFLLGYMSRKESDELAVLAAEENFETSENSVYYNSANLKIASYCAYVLGGITFFVVLFSLSTISLSIAIIKSAALFVASNFWIVLLPIFMALIAIVYFLAWAVMLAYLWSIGESVPRTMSPLAEIEWTTENQVYIGAHIFSLLWNIAYLNYLMVFVIGCACAIWYFNNKDSPNYFSSPIRTSFWWAFRYHLGSIALGSFILAIVWLV